MKRLISILLIVCLIATSLPVPPAGYASNFLDLPLPGSRVESSPIYTPVIIKGLKVHPENPLLFDFILDSGDSKLDINSPEFKKESEKLVKYFLTSLTIKEEDLWVNLSPFEKERIVPDELGKTELGRQMLAQDYILKQLTASMIYPEKQLGKEFWDRIYAKAKKMFGTTDVPVNTFNKVWIVADKAKVLERNNVGLVVRAHLKVLLEEDYVALSNQRDKAESLSSNRDVALSKNGEASSVKSETILDSRATNDENVPRPTSNVSQQDNANTISSQIIREIILPEIEKEVNEGKNFAPLRQIYYAMILAAWYKRAIKNALLNHVYSNKGKTSGLLTDDPQIKEKIYQQYLEAFKVGVFNYIKEDIDAVSQEVIPRKYFSGGTLIFPSAQSLERSLVPALGDETGLKGTGAEATVQMNLPLGDGTAQAAKFQAKEKEYEDSPVLTELYLNFNKILSAKEYSDDYFNQELINAAKPLLAKAEEVFKPEANFNKIKQEFEALHAKALKENQGERLKIFIPDFDQALVILNIGTHVFKSDFLYRIKRIAEYFPRASVLFLGMLGVHSRFFLDPEDLEIYPDVVSAVVNFMLRDDITQQERKQAGRALINGLMSLEDREKGKYEQFLNTLESDVSTERLKRALYDAFSLNRDLNSQHPMFTWYWFNAIDEWISTAFSKNRTLEDIALADNNLEVGRVNSLGNKELIHQRFQRLQQFSGFDPSEIVQDAGDDRPVQAPQARKRTDRVVAVDKTETSNSKFSESQMRTKLASLNLREAEDFVEQLIALNDSQLIDPLIHLLSDPNKDVRLRAIRVLRAIGKVNSKAVDALRVKMADPDVRVARSAIESLSWFKKEVASRAVEDLIKELDDPRFQMAAIVTLGFIEDNRAVPKLIEILNSSQDSIILDEVILALRKIGDPQSIDRLIQLSQRDVVKENTFVYERMLNALSRLFLKLEENDRRRVTIVEIFRQAFKESDRFVRQAASAGLVMARRQGVLVSSDVIERVLTGSAIKVIFENMVWEGLEKDYLDDIIQGAFRTIPGAHLKLANAFDVEINSESFSLFVDQFVHWSNFRELTRRDRMEFLGGVGNLIVQHMWQVGLHPEDGRLLDNEALIKIARSFIDSYLDWRNQAGDLNEDQKKYDALFRMMIKLMVDGRIHKAQYVEAIRFRSFNMDAADQFYIGSDTAPGILAGLSEDKRAVISNIISEKFDVNVVLKTARSIDDETYKSFYEYLMRTKIAKMIGDIKSKVKNDDVWAHYEDALPSQLKARAEDLSAVKNIGTTVPVLSALMLPALGSISDPVELINHLAMSGQEVQAKIWLANVSLDVLHVGIIAAAIGLGIGIYKWSKSQLSNRNAVTSRFIGGFLKLAALLEGRNFRKIMTGREEIKWQLNLISDNLEGAERKDIKKLTREFQEKIKSVDIDRNIDKKEFRKELVEEIWIIIQKLHAIRVFEEKILITKPSIKQFKSMSSTIGDFLWMESQDAVVNFNLIEPAQELLAKAEEVFDPAMDTINIERIRREFDDLRTKLRESLSDNLQSKFDVLIPDFDHALTILLLPAYPYRHEKKFYQRVRMVSNHFPRATTLFLGLLGIHARQKLDEEDQEIYLDVVKAVVKDMERQNATQSEIKQTGRALINGLVALTLEFKYNDFLNFLGSDPSFNSQLKKALRVAFGMNPDLYQNENLHPILTWNSGHGTWDWIKGFKNGKTLSQLAYLDGGFQPEERELGWEMLQIQTNWEKLIEFSGYQLSSSTLEGAAPGGIDLNPRNMDLDVGKEGSGIEIKFDPVLIKQLEDGNFSGVVPVILRITPITSPLTTLGLDDPSRQPALASL